MMLGKIMSFNYQALLSFLIAPFAYQQLYEFGKPEKCKSSFPPLFLAEVPLESSLPDSEQRLRDYFIFMGQGLWNTSPI